MTVRPWPDHLLSLQEWDELPEDRSHHLELVEGVLVVAPRPAPQHQIAMTNLTSALNRQLPGTLTATPDTEVVIDSTFPPTVRAPDVLVMSRSLYERNPPRIDAGEVLLAVEIVSPGTGRRDRFVKAGEYAGAGIPYHWIIDLTPPASLTTLALVGREYEITDKATGPITLSEPATITVDVSRLTQPSYLW
ncbi:Uma2 family endonuclease [Actinophytocola sp.]|uniref:Uma2 family endonuclease n=1 Tax=Actinophytocola sp. TaxID=1872138 RepID=UPI002ED31807